MCGGFGSVCGLVCVGDVGGSGRVGTCRGGSAAVVGGDGVAGGVVAFLWGATGRGGGAFTRRDRRGMRGWWAVFGGRGPCSGLPQPGYRGNDCRTRWHGRGVLARGASQRAPCRLGNSAV